MHKINFKRKTRNTHKERITKTKKVQTITTKITLMVD